MLSLRAKILLFYIPLQKYNNISKHARKSGKSFRKSYWQGENVYKCAKNIRKMKWYPIIRILLYLREIESKEKNYKKASNDMRWFVDRKSVIQC